MPTRTVDADPDLGRKCPLGDLAIERGAGKAGAVENGLEADDLFGIRHGTCFHKLAVDETSRDQGLAACFAKARTFPVHRSAGRSRMDWEKDAMTRQ